MAGLTSCETCGMEWTATPRELCPRCDLEAKRDSVETLRARVVDLERERDEALAGEHATAKENQAMTEAIERLTDELEKPENVRLRDAIAEMDGYAPQFCSLADRISAVLDDLYDAQGALAADAVAAGLKRLAPECDSALADRDALRGALSEALPYVESAAAETLTYGAFPGGDPRQFTPEPEESTDEEREAHREACARWDAATTTLDGESPAHQWEGDRHVAHAKYGHGTYLYRDPHASALLTVIRALLAAVPTAAAPAPRCATCRDTGWIETTDCVEPGVYQPCADPCPDCTDGMEGAPATGEGGERP